MYKFILPILFLTVLPIDSFALNDFHPQNNWISFTTDTPPSLIYVTDTQGHRTGADPSLPFDQYGRQGDKHSGLEEIPGSMSEQNNERNPLTGLPKKITTWSVTIPDSGSQTYIIHLIGIKNSTNNIHFNSGFVQHPKAGSSIVMDILSSVGVTQTFSVSFNSSDQTQSGLKVQKIISNNDLLNDVKTACQLNLITSHRVCKHLEKTAKAIQDALEDKQEEKVEELVKSFLHSLGEQVGDDDKDRDDHKSIKEPTLTILKEDAKALLAQIEKSENHREHAKR
jgi:hypothetical protein